MAEEETKKIEEKVIKEEVKEKKVEKTEAPKILPARFRRRLRVRFGKQ